MTNTYFTIIGNTKENAYVSVRVNYEAMNPITYFLAIQHLIITDKNTCKYFFFKSETRMTASVFPSTRQESNNSTLQKDKLFLFSSHVFVAFTRLSVV